MTTLIVVHAEAAAAALRSVIDRPGTTTDVVIWRQALGSRLYDRVLLMVPVTTMSAAEQNAFVRYRHDVLSTKVRSRAGIIDLLDC